MAKHLSIVGLVQGVNYRTCFEAQAHALQLSGWVRNRRDGSVEAMVAGPDDALAKIIDWARCGPPGARVREVLIMDADDSLAKNRPFEILPTK